MLLGVGHTGRSVVRRPRASYGWRSAVRTSFVRTADTDFTSVNGCYLLTEGMSSKNIYFIYTKAVVDVSYPNIMDIKCLHGIVQSRNLYPKWILKILGLTPL